MVYPSVDGHESKYQPSPVSINFVDATNYHQPKEMG